MKDGTNVTIRPIRPEDELLMAKFHETLSERSVYLRYFQYSKLDQRVAHDRLVRMCFLDYDREIALLVERGTTSSQSREIIGIGRLSKRPGSHDAEVAFLVRDQYQRQGIGTELWSRLDRNRSRNEHLERLLAFILLENTEMQSLVRKAGFEIAEKEDPSILCGSFDLSSTLAR